MQLGIEAAAEPARPEFGHIGGGGGEQTHRIERGREGHHAFGGEQTEAGLEAADAAEGGGTEHGAESLRSRARRGPCRRPRRRRNPRNCLREYGRGSADCAWERDRRRRRRWSGSCRAVRRRCGAGRRLRGHRRFPCGPRKGGEPYSVARPRVSKISLTPKGMPSSRPSARAACGDTSTQARISRSLSAMRRRQISSRSASGLLAGLQSLEELEQHYIDQSSLKKPACTIFPAKRESGGTVMSTMA